VHRIDLLRHAKSSWSDPSLADLERPLSPRGVKASARLREHLGRSRVAPDLVLCSPAVRTVETLDRVRDGLPADTRIEIEDDLYGAGADSLLARLRRLPDALGSLMLIGHNPGIEDLALGLVGDGDASVLERMRRKYPTGGLATLSFDGAWSELGPATARLEAFVIPKQLK
jgi:phosphohistidine phosphatase